MVDVDIETKRKMCFGKKAYNTEKYAKKVKGRIENERNVKLRVYQCPICGYFHLTHIEMERN